MRKVAILSDNHTHQDKPVKKGTILEVDEATAKHLVELKAAKYADEK